MLVQLLYLLCLGDIAYGKPLSASDWQVRQQPELNISGAVVLEDHTRFSASVIERYRRVRVLSELGKSAAEFIDDTASVRKLEGRVVDVGGEETVFGQKSDLVEVLNYKRRGDAERVRILVPPGLTTDCIVEMAWAIPADGALPLQRDAYFEEVAEPWFIVLKTYSFANLRHHRGWSINGTLKVATRQLWSSAGDEHFRQTKDQGRQVVSYLKIPARVNYPFGSAFRYDNAHFINVFKTFPDFSRNPQVFWEEVLKNYVRPYLFGFEFNPGKSYSAWLTQLRSDLPAEPSAAMTYLLGAFRERIASDRLLRPEQLQRLAIPRPASANPATMLADAFHNGIGNSLELNLLFYHLVMDSGVPFRLVFPSSSDQWPFDPESRQPFYFSYNFPLFAVQKDQDLILFSPERYEYGPGLFPVRYEGMLALVTDPRSGWHPEFRELHSSQPESNRLVTLYTTRLDSDFGYHMSIKRQVSGHYAAQYRRTYITLPAQERNELLANQWRDLGVFLLLDATVSAADELGSALTEEVSLRVEPRPQEVSSYAFQPFPNSYRPLATPSYWPAGRDQDLFLPFARKHSDINTLTVPEGWMLSGDNNWKRSNTIGEVVFQATQSGRKVTVRRDLSVNGNHFPRSAERQLKAYLAWMDEAFEQNIAFVLPETAP